MLEKNVLAPQGDERRGQTAEPRRHWITPTVSTIDLRAAESYGSDDTKDSGISAT